MATGTLTRSLTHAQLVAAITAGTLHKGESITITDYATKHNVQDGATFLAELHTGISEPLLVTAISNNTLALEARSVLFPKDIIHYDTSNVLCEDGITARKGKITFRKDHLGNETHYDFRGVIFRRWKFDLSLFTAWVSAGTFTRGGKVTYNNKLFYCTNSISGSIDNPEILTTNFNYVTDNQRFLSWQTSVVRLGADPVNQDSIYIPVSPIYQDFHTFSNSAGEQKSEWYKKVVIAKWGSYNSIVFVETAINRTHGVTFDENCYFMMFGNSNSSNTFGNSNSSNTFGNNNSSNTFGNDNYSNTFGNNNSSNTFGNDNYYNTFGNSNNSNTFGNGNYYNTFGNDNSYNTFGNNNNSNTFGNNNNSNTFGNDNYANTFGNDNSYNTFGNNNYSNTFGNDNYANTFGNDNYYNTFGGIAIIQNTFKNSINGTAVNYSISTHLVGGYDCEISQRLDGIAKLKYINNSDVEVIVAANA